jgi:hypothetical protein
MWKNRRALGRQRLENPGISHLAALMSKLVLPYSKPVPKPKIPNMTL